MKRHFSRLLPLVVAAVAVASGRGLAQPADVNRVLEVPGLDFSKLAAPARKELAGVFTDEFDYCGRPMTLAASLKKGDACKHSKRMAGYAGILAAEGVPTNEIIVALSKYNQSFSARRATFKIDERMCKGPADAKVTLVEFSDFECPYCNAARPLLDDLLKKRKDTRVCFMPFPLAGHPNAVPASTAALFARDAGKFWPMHDALFDNQLQLSEAVIKKLAGKLGLDEKALSKALADGKYTEELNASKDAGKAAGVDATPMVYFNGRKLSLNPGADALSLALDDELDWAAGKSAWPSN